MNVEIEKDYTIKLKLDRSETNLLYNILYNTLISVNASFGYEGALNLRYLYSKLDEEFDS